MQDFLNRLSKNIRELRRWAARRGIEAYRVYDRDVPGYPFAIDIYGKWAVVASRARDSELDEQVQQHSSVLSQTLGVVEDQIVWRKRMRQRGLAQYEKLAIEPVCDVIPENGMSFEINLTQYLDVGVFLDHRKTRLLLKELSQGKKCLNLFCYTGTASVAMACGGARHVLSMDLSKTYLAWAERNFRLSGCWDPSSQELAHQDIISWLSQPGCGQKFDLIFVDPPSFSNSKRMDGTFDVQRDHAWLLRRLAERLTPTGCVVFSNNRSGFSLDRQLIEFFQIQDVTQWTHPRDFRTRRAHSSFVLTKNAHVLEETVRALKSLGPDC